MNTIIVHSLESLTRERLVTVGSDTALADVAKLLANPRTSLVIVCHFDRSIAGVISKTDVVRRIGEHPESVCETAAADVMTRDVILAGPVTLCRMC
jgi:CBS domain-containing protein